MNEEEKTPSELLRADMTEEEVEKALDSVPDGETEEWEDDQAVPVEEVRALLEARSFSALRALLEGHHPEDIAVLFDEVDEEKYPLLFRILPKASAAEVFAAMSAENQKNLLESFTDRELREVLEEMAMDDTVDLIEEMPANVARRIVANSSKENRALINRILQYPKNSAGSLMTTEYVGFRKDLTVKEAFAILRRVAIDKETVYTCYVTDRNRTLIGVVSVQELLMASDATVLEDIMTTSVISVTTHTDQEDVAAVFDRYRFLALPVVDQEDRLLGIITVDDAVEVMKDEAEEDFAKMAAMAPAETPYLKTSVFSICRSRFPWLLILMLSATFTGIIISAFESALAACVALTAFIPMLMGTGGNSGSQASVTVIRGISLGEIRFRDTFRVMWRELRIALLCGFLLSVATFGKVLLVDGLWMGSIDLSANGIWIALAVSTALCVTVVVAKLIGCSLPLLAHKIGFDPAVMASPLITTVVDAVSLIVYFAIARAMLGI